MRQDDSWDDIRSDRNYGFGSAGMSAVRVALLFGSAAVALALIVTPMAENHVRSQFSASSRTEGLDMTTTGSIGYSGSYTIRKSVLQQLPSSVCVIRDNGVKSGDC